MAALNDGEKKLKTLLIFNLKQCYPVGFLLKAVLAWSDSTTQMKMVPLGLFPVFCGLLCDTVHVLIQCQ